MSVDQLAPNATTQFPKGFKTATHLLSVFIPGAIMGLLMSIIVLGQIEGPKTWLIYVGVFPLTTLAYALYAFLYYLLAGGMEWKTETMSFLRMYIFLFLSFIILGIFYLVIWHAVRSIMAKRYQIPLEMAKGHLLYFSQKSSKAEAQEPTPAKAQEPTPQKPEAPALPVEHASDTSRVSENLRAKQLIMDYHFENRNEQQLRVIAEGLADQLTERYGSLIDPDKKMEIMITLQDFSVCIIAITKPITAEKVTEITHFVAQCANAYKEQKI